MPVDGDSPPSPRGREAIVGRERHEPHAEEWISARSGDGSLPRSEARKDGLIRQWDVVTPSATRIGRPETPDGDVSETLRRLHDEQHPAMTGHGERMHRLDKARIAHALCNALDLTPWERDRVLGIVSELDFTAFGSQRSIPKVSLVVIRYVVDRERQIRLGLTDREWIGEQSPERLATLYERFVSIKDDESYRRLLEQNGLDTTSVNRLTRVLREQLEAEDLDGAVFGRQPYRDPNLPRMRESGPEAASADAD